MKFVFKYFAITIFIFLTSCETGVKQDFEKHIKHFKLFILEEPFDVFSSLPSNGNFLRVINPSALYYKGYCGLFFKDEPQDEEFLSVLSSLENLSIFKSDFQDTLSFFVPNFKESSPEERFPIPGLDDPVYSFRDSLDAQNTVILGFRRGMGNFFNDKGIEKVKEFAKPEDQDNFGNGYANGAFIDHSSKLIIYWVIIW
ncbi:MAG: hypothetical protein K0B15_10685 [Lentimicrobium sp.]|nr:hypothetical protein [Lentimicrobium sp.]